MPNDKSKGFRVLEGEEGSQAESDDDAGITTDRESTQDEYQLMDASKLTSESHRASRRIVSQSSDASRRSTQHEDL